MSSTVFWEWVWKFFRSLSLQSHLSFFFFFNGYIIFYSFVWCNFYCWAEDSSKVQAWMWSCASWLEKHRTEVCVLDITNSHMSLRDYICVLKKVRLALDILQSNLCTISQSLCARGWNTVIFFEDLGVYKTGLKLITFIVLADRNRRQFWSNLTLISSSVWLALEGINNLVFGFKPIESAEKKLHGILHVY